MAINNIKGALIKWTSTFLLENTFGQSFNYNDSKDDSILCESTLWTNI